MLARRAVSFKKESGEPPGELPPLEPDEIRRFVDPDATGTPIDGLTWDTAYRSLSAWEAAERTNLVTAGNWHHVYVRASSGTADTTQVTVDGWTTGASNNIVIEAAPGDEAVKTGWDTNRYRLDVTDPTSGALELLANYVELKGLQIRYNYSATQYSNALRIYGWSNGGTFLIDGCRIEITGGANYGITAQSGGETKHTVTVQNTIINGARDGIKVINDELELYNSIIYGDDFGAGVDHQGTNPDTVATNSAVFNCSDDFDVVAGTSTITYCASDDGDGTNPVSPSGSDWDNELNDSANGDFTLLNTGNLYLGGTPIAGGPLVDIDGDPWNATNPSIGVDEYV